MSQMSLVLETLNGMPLECKFPSDMTAREVADDIANQLSYPVVDDDTNEPINYYLADSGGKRMDDNTKLEDAGLRDGDTVKIQASKAIIPPPLPETPVAVSEGELGLWIKLLNQTRSVYETFDTETSVSDLLARMIAKYDLPAQYPSSNEPIVYVVSSKTQGRQLHGVETLREAHIEHLDTLFINSDNKAGGPTC
jgi:WXG100 protein secretion system (Wss), protein YukD